MLQIGTDAFTAQCFQSMYLCFNQSLSSLHPTSISVDDDDDSGDLS